MQSAAPSKKLSSILASRHISQPEYRPSWVSGHAMLERPPSPPPLKGPISAFAQSVTNKRIDKSKERVIIMDMQGVDNMADAQDAQGCFLG
mmetsp:Transcript_102175/g.196108  ORF Transcript_102175/g.196108 Transcript_102175/m.196108 type:complete len:91 (-) Transcript_102175:67-339(-)